MHTTVPATGRKNTLVVLAHALGLDQATITAITVLARVTRTMRHATSTKRTWEVLARVSVGSSRCVASVILIPALNMHTLALATSTRSTLAVRLPAPELDQAITAITILALVTCIVAPAISREGTSEVTATAAE